MSLKMLHGFTKAGLLILSLFMFSSTVSADWNAGVMLLLTCGLIFPCPMAPHKKSAT